MRICRWCGRKLWWPFSSYCKKSGCRRAVYLNAPSPPCHYMQYLPEAGE